MDHAATRVLIVVLVVCASCSAPARPPPPVPVIPAGSFACVITTCGWRAADVSHALSIGRDESLARAAREAAMNDAMVAAQRPTAGQTCSTAITDQALARESAGLQEVLPILLAVIQSYRARDLAASAAASSACVRDFATRELARVTSLVGQQRLFRLPPSRVAGRVVYAGADVHAYFAHELDRARAAIALAQPFLAVLDNTQVAEPSGPDAAAYWHSSLTELQRFTQNGDRDGQVGALEALIAKIATLDATRCKAALASVPEAPAGNDLFSDQRRALLADLRARCIR